jgi:sigma-54 dependent transcriptional regulator, flagellar regulatory protein
MRDARILVIDGDEERGRRTQGLIEFMDCHARVVGDVGEIELACCRSTDWIAIVLGSIRDQTSWSKFAQWLSRDPAHPPLLLMPEHKEFDPSGLGLHPASLWTLSHPVRHAQLSEMLRRAGIKQFEEVRAKVPPNEAEPTGSSYAARSLRGLIKQVAGFDTTVLILGESGTGKEVAARAIHAASSRSTRPFVAVNCGAIPADLLESELFGHEKGAFTGALSQRKGRFELAEGGTLLLDEIGDMSMPMQVKLLRVLQERQFERVGGSETLRSNVRIIAATHRKLEHEIERGRFREDLYYRLNVFPIDMPTVRDRASDIPELADVIARQLQAQGRSGAQFTPDALQMLMAYSWPGNVRELTNLIERLAVLHPGVRIRAEDLPSRYRTESCADTVVHTPDHALDSVMSIPAISKELSKQGLDLKEHLAEIEVDLLCRAMTHSGGVIAHAAQLLKLRRTTLVEKLRKYGIERGVLNMHHKALVASSAA